jgi:hypothetical protein
VSLVGFVVVILSKVSCTYVVSEFVQ